MTTTKRLRELHHTAFLTGEVLFFNEATYFPRTFSNHCRPHERWYLWVAFTEKKDASEYRLIAGRVGSYARCIKLPRAVRQIIGEKYHWGVWVSDHYAMRLAQINCHWGETGGFDLFNQKETIR